jgi:hypothetical protein
METLMNTEVRHHQADKEARQGEGKKRHEYVRQQIDTRHKGLRTSIAAGGLLALMGLSAWLLA